MFAALCCVRVVAQCRWDSSGKNNIALEDFLWDGYGVMGKLGFQMVTASRRE